MPTKKQLVDWVKSKISDETTPTSELVDYQLFITLSGKGKAASVAENRQLKKLLIELEQRFTLEEDGTTKAGTSSWLCKAADLQYMWGLSLSAIKKYVSLGMPRAGRGVYDVRACLDWWLDNIYKGKGVEERDEDMVQAKRRYWSSKADEAELKVRERRGEFIRAEEHDAVKTAMCSDLRNTMLSWPSRIFPNDDDARQRLRQEVFALLESFIRAGNFAVEPAKRGTKKKAKPPTKQGTKKKPSPKKKKTCADAG